MERARGLVTNFCANFATKLPAELDFATFKKMIGVVCMNSSQLRMIITMTPESQTGRDVVVSQVSTIILEYLP